MAERPHPLYSKQVKLSRSTVFLDVYEGQRGPYLQLCESKKNKEGVYEKVRLFFDREGVSALKIGLREVEDYFLSLPGGGNAGGKAPPASPGEQVGPSTPPPTSEAPTGQPGATAVAGTGTGGQQVPAKRAAW